MTFRRVLMKQKASELLGFRGNGGGGWCTTGMVGGRKTDLSNIHTFSNQTEDLFESEKAEEDQDKNRPGECW